LGPNVQPVKLPNQGEEPAVGAPATVIGWGFTSVNIPIIYFIFIYKVLNQFYFPKKLYRFLMRRVLDNVSNDHQNKK